MGACNLKVPRNSPPALSGIFFFAAAAAAAQRQRLQEDQAHRAPLHSSPSLETQLELSSRGPLFQYQATEW